MSKLARIWYDWRKEAIRKKDQRKEMELREQIAAFILKMLDDKQFSEIMKLTEKEYKLFRILKYLEELDK